VNDTTPVQVCQAGPADAALLSDVASATFALACPPHTSPESIADFIDKNFTVAKFDGYLADAQRVLFLATLGGEAIGYAMLVLGEPADADVRASITLHPTAELSKLYVRPGHHGAGVSAGLVEACFDAATVTGCAGIWLGVNQENARANRFYEKSGFARVGVKKFLVGERWEDDFVRERAL
jgi:ribosomal protein S18 acetylase RimI-like enzyme